MLKIKRDAFLEGFSALADFPDATPHGDPSLTYADGNWVDRSEGMEIAISASGDLEGAMWVSGH